MAIESKLIRVRRGTAAKFEVGKSKIISGEFAVVTDTEEAYFSPQDGKSVRLATEKDVSQLEESIADLEANGSGLNGTQKDLILALFEAGTYTKDVSQQLEALRESFEVQVSSVSISPSSLSLTGITTSQLTATIKPSDAMATVYWSSSNEDVATVDANGLVTTVGNGSATITAVAGAKSATCAIEVSGIKATYPVTYNLTDVSSSNTIAVVEEGSEFTATLTTEGTYKVGGVSVTMGGEDITSTAYADGVVTISNVTGAIVITATAMEDLGWEEGVAYNLTFTDGYIVNKDGTVTENASFRACEPIPVKGVDYVNAGSNIYNGRLVFYDESDTFVGCVSSNANFGSELVESGGMITVPPNAHYARASIRITIAIDDANVFAIPYTLPLIGETTVWESGDIYKLDYTDGVGLNTSTGVETTNDTMRSSAFALCYGATSLLLSNILRSWLIFYDAEKNYISTTVIQNTYAEQTVPENAYYFRRQVAAGINEFVKII